MGAITPLGNDVQTYWDGLINGRSGIDRLQSFDPSRLAVQIGGEVKGFDPTEFLDRKETRRQDRFVQFAVVAAMQALEDAKLKIDSNNGFDVGVLIGSGIGGISTLVNQVLVMEEKGPNRLSPFLIPMMIADMASGQVSITFGAKGPNYATVSACSSSAHAIGEAFEIIRRGDAEAMITGGSEAAMIEIAVGAFAAARTLSTRNDEPQKASRPFDAKRDGFVMSEGSGILILEELSYAQARGAPIRAEILSYGATADAFHITAPPPGGEGAVASMQMALRKAKLPPEAISYINAHGTSTELNDRTETQAVKFVFGKYAYELPISSTKSMTGHLLGAGGAVEAIACVKAIEEGIIPPTINYEFPDPDCDLDYVPNVAREAPVEIALSNSLGFGGHNVTLILRKFRD